MSKRFGALDIPAIRDLKLVIIANSDEADFLVSLTHRVLLVAGEQCLAEQDAIPYVEIDSKIEKEACREAGKKYDGGWPGWSVIFDYLDHHPELLRPRGHRDDFDFNLG